MQKVTTQSDEPSKRSKPQSGVVESIRDQATIEPRLSKLGTLLVQGVALAVPLSYATGRIYSDAYWRELGLSASLMDRTTSDFVYLGFVTLVNALAHYVGLDPYSTMGTICTIAAVVGAFLLFVWAVGTWVGPWLRRGAKAFDARLQQMRQLAKHEVANRFFAITSFALGLAFCLFVLLWCCLVLFLFVALASREGQREATAVRDSFISAAARNTSHPPAMVWLRMGPSSRLLGRLVECSSRWCVVFQDGNFIAVPASDVTRIEQLKLDLQPPPVPARRPFVAQPDKPTER